MRAALWVFHEKRGHERTEHVKPEAWTSATHVSVSENLQYLYCAVCKFITPVMAMKMIDVQFEVIF